jgi:hypothetical protein
VFLVRIGFRGPLFDADAAENHLPFWIGDHRHFRAIRELEVSVFRPAKV